MRFEQKGDLIKAPHLKINLKPNSERRKNGDFEQNYKSRNSSGNKLNWSGVRVCGNISTYDFSKKPEVTEKKTSNNDAKLS